jgi:hypothetical protein
MAVTINADTVTGAAIVTADASGELALQAAGNTGLTLNSSRAIGVGASPSFGTSGQALLSAGSGAAPAWGDVQAPLVSGTNIKTINGGSVLGSGDLAVGGGSWIFLSSVTASNSATVDLDYAFDTTYDAYKIVASDLSFTVNAVEAYIRVKIGGSYATSAYQYFQMAFASGESTFSGALSANSQPEIPLLESKGSSASQASVNFELTLYVPGSSSKNKMMTIVGVSFDTDSRARNIQGALGIANTGVLQGVRFYPVVGNVSTGTLRLYGIKNS